PQGFFDSIPSNPAENISWRINFHEKVARDEGLQRVYKELCWKDIKILFNSAMWVYDAEASTGFRNRPFILWPHQEPAVDAIHNSILNQHNLVIDKSRKEGATEIICKTFIGHFLLDPESQFLVGSRNAMIVDKGVELINGRLVGLHKTLMHKVCYAIYTLPNWLKPEVMKTYMLLQNMDNGSVISGEATNESFGAGDRQKGVLIDEYGRMDHNMAININDSIHDTSDCVIFNSTHFWGVEHPYNQLITQKFGEIPVIVMPWTENPNKNTGLYISPDYDIIEIKDIDYYKEQCPEVFNNIEEMKSFKLSDLRRDHQDKPWSKKLEEIIFVADGGDSNEGGWRSLWYDKKSRERRPRDVACNIDRRPKGSGSSVFSISTLHRIEETTIFPPIFVGDVVIKRNRELLVSKGIVVPGGVGRLRWWGKLKNGRPDQTHNYIVGGDIGLGRGASNSVLSIVDVNLCEEVGQWICATTSPEDFADTAVALCKWIGGLNKEPYLIWESNGIGGVFEGRIVKNRYPFIYIRRDETARRKKKKNKRGWCNTKGPDGTKYRLLMDLDMALKEGLSKNPLSKHLTIHCEQTIREMESYLFNNAGTPHPAKAVEDEDSTANAAHGDRVIALGLCCLALEYQPKAMIARQKEKKSNTLGERMKERKREAAKKTNRRFIY
ncbi:hypothetical protein LCGC14_1886030, partial [marine sediment metagenome]